MKKFWKRGFEFLIKHDVIEPLFDSEYPTLSKAWVEAFKKLADNQKLAGSQANKHFLMSPGAPVFFKYKVHPQKAILLFFCWLRQGLIRNG